MKPKVCWAKDSFPSVLYCLEPGVHWLTFPIDFLGSSMMHRDILGPRYEVPCIKISISSSMASESLLVGLCKTCKVSCLQALIRNCCLVVLSLGFYFAMSELVALLEFASLLCSSSLLLMRVNIEPSQISSPSDPHGFIHKRNMPHNFAHSSKIPNFQILNTQTT